MSQKTKIQGVLILFLCVASKGHASRQYFSQSHLARCSKALSRNGFANALEDSYSPDDKENYSEQIKKNALELRTNPQSEAARNQFIEKLSMIYFPFLLGRIPKGNDQDALEVLQTFLIRSFLAVTSDAYKPEMGQSNVSAFYYFLKIAKRELENFGKKSSKDSRTISLDALNKDPEKQKIEAVDGGGILGQHSSGSSSSESDEAKDLSALVIRIVDQFSQSEKMVFNLRVNEGLSFQEIALDSRVQLSPKSVRNVFGKVQRRLKIRLKRVLSHDTFQYWYKKGIF